jgi:hypothetical protein
MTITGVDIGGGDFSMETHVILTYLVSVLTFWLG